MSSQLAIEQTISSFQALHERLNLCRTSETSFFPEWQTPTIELAESDKAFGSIAVSGRLLDSS